MRDRTILTQPRPPAPDVGEGVLTTSSALARADHSGGRRSAPSVQMASTGLARIRGAMSMSTGHLTGLITAAQQAGFDAHVHIDGDGTVRAVLDAIEQAACHAEGSAADAGPGTARRPARHIIAHNTLIHPDDLGRYASLGVIANITPAWGTDYDGTYVGTHTSLIGPDRIRERLFPNRELLRAGAMPTIGADVPGVDITDTAPLIQLEAAVTRRRPGYPDDRPLAPHQALPLADALRAHTINGAYHLRAEDTTGSLEAGKKADLLVLSDDLFAIAPERIHATSVVLTMMDGVITHSLSGVRIT
ncbi:MAG: amidohydrolase family protein [Streptosporangiaceae bacterium]